MKYAAFLRGINVGGRIVKMDDLRANFKGIGLTKVKTFLQTGNVLFESDLDPELLKTKIEASLTREFGYDAKVQVIGLDTLQDIIDAYPFDEANQNLHNYIIFFENNLEGFLASEATELDSTIELIQVGRGVMYWQVPKGRTLKSRFAKYLTVARYKHFHTNRNINTLRKMIG